MAPSSLPTSIIRTRRHLAAIIDEFRELHDDAAIRATAGALVDEAQAQVQLIARQDGDAEAHSVAVDRGEVAS
jgi:hypothetical protein